MRLRIKDQRFGARRPLIYGKYGWKHGDSLCFSLDTHPSVGTMGCGEEGRGPCACPVCLLATSGGQAQGPLPSFPQPIVPTKIDQLVAFSVSAGSGTVRSTAGRVTSIHTK